VRKNWAGWSAAAVLALLIGILVFLGGRLSVSYLTPLTGCAHDDGTGGASSLYRLARRLNLPVVLLDRPSWEAEKTLPAATGNVLISMGENAWSPRGNTEKGDSDHWPAVRAWIEQGNTLLVATTEPESIPSALMGGAAFAVLPGSQKNASNTRDQPVIVDQRNPVETINLRGASLTVVEDGRRAKLSSEAETLAQDERGGVLFRIPAGRGAIVVLLDDHAWANSGLDLGSNAPILIELVRSGLEPGGVLAFDEYRHGHGRSESFLSFLLGVPGVPAGLAITTLWALAFVYGRNVRLRPAVPLVAQPRRTGQDAIDAQAQIYERARAATLVVQAVALRLRQLARSSAQTPQAVVDVLEKADSYVQTGERPAKPAEAKHLVQQILQTRKDFYGNRTVL